MGKWCLVDRGRQSRHFNPLPERYGRKILQSADTRLEGTLKHVMQRLLHMFAKYFASTEYEEVHCSQELKENLHGALSVLAVSEACGGADS